MNNVRIISNYVMLYTQGKFRILGLVIFDNPNPITWLLSEPLVSSYRDNDACIFKDASGNTYFVRIENEGMVDFLREPFARYVQENSSEDKNYVFFDDTLSAIEKLS